MTYSLHSLRWANQNPYRPSNNYMPGMEGRFIMYLWGKRNGSVGNNIYYDQISA